jgi:glucose-1-phosphate cytidylyltransferase
MKVVLFCGGYGMRLREYSDSVPKPMVEIGYRPIIWNIMKYYAHFGHKEFILCLGYKADVIKDYFIHYDETVSNNFILKNGGKDITLLSKDIDDWSITFVDTGLNSNIGMRLFSIKDYLQDDEVFLANYSDGLSDLDLNKMIHWFTLQNDKVASFVAYQPTQSFHVVNRKENGEVNSISHIGDSGLYINTGYFILRKEIFNYMNWGEELVDEPFHRLIKEHRLTSYEHTGFWASMDTFKDKQNLDDAFAKGNPPWEIWNKHSSIEHESIKH